MTQPFLQLGTTVEGKRPFILSGTDFEKHKVISGITGAGKSFFLAAIFLLIFRLGITTLLIDPNGDLAKLILTLLASSDYFTDPRAYARLWYVDFKRAEKDAAIAFNVLKQDYEAHTVSSNLLESMHRAFPVSGTTTSLDNVLEAASLVLIENSLPITELPRLILDADFRERLLQNVSDPLVTSFFRSEFGEKTNKNLVASTMRRSFLLTFSPVLRNTLGQKENRLNMRRILDSGISCIFNLGGLDDQSKRLLGGALLVNIEQAFLSRADIDPTLRKPAHVIIDEFPVFSSHSEQSFAVILEQVRKYKGTLYLAHQTQSQLSSGMAGSLQNAVSINMKSGYTDSSTLVQQFYRPRVEQSEDFFDGLLRAVGVMPEKERSVFAEVENTNQAKYLFETLQRQEAIVSLNGISTLIKTNTIPSVNVDPRTLAEIENTYATKLLTPLSQIGKEVSVSHLTLVKPAALAKRRVPGEVVDGEPLQFITGSLLDDLLTALFHLHYATLTQLCKLLGRESSINHVRDKLNSLKTDGMLESTTLPRSSAGKPPVVYFLTQSTLKDMADSLGLPVPLATGEKKHGYLEHTLACTDLAVASITLPQANKSFTLMNVKHERTLKNSAIKLSEGVYLVPDGWVHLRLNNTEDIGICLELDRSTEDRNKIISKLNNYVAFASGTYQRVFGFSSLSIAFCVEGDFKRVKELISWAQPVLKDNPDAAALFLFGSVSPGAIEPDSFFLDSTFLSPFDNTRQALVEI